MAKTAKHIDVEQAEEATDLAVMAQVNPLAIFTDEAKFSEFYQRLKAETDKHVPDISTAKGRDAIRSLARRVVKAKTTLKKAGLDLTEEWRRQTALVTASRKKMEDELAELAAEVRRPLTEWEEKEKARVAACEATIQRMREAAVVTLEDTSETVRQRGAEVWEIQIDDAEFGDLADEAKTVKSQTVATLHSARERLIKEEEDRAELERLRAEAAEREALEAEEREKREREEAERRAEEERKRREEEARVAEEQRIREAEERAAQAAREEEERKAREAEEERERQHQAALAEERRRTEEAERIAREEREARAREEAERRRQEEERAAEAKRQAEEQARREADRAHRQRIQRAAKEAIMTCGADEDTAKKIVLAIVAGEVPAVSIRF